MKNRNSIAFFTFVCLGVLFILPATFAVAYHPTSGAYETAQNNWTTACVNLERQISHLENLDRKAGDIEVSITVNDEELRDALLSAPQHYSIDVIEAWASATSAAALTTYDIYDGIVLRDALSKVAGAINTQMDKVGTESDSPPPPLDKKDGTESDSHEGYSYFARRKAAYNELVKQINIHNTGHSGDDIGLPTQPETTHDVSRRTPPPPPLVYFCTGGCGREVELMSYGIPHDQDHQKRCELPVRRALWNLWRGKCPGLYYNCNGQTSADCPHASYHISGSSSANSQSGSLSGSSSASAGGSYTVNLTTSTPFSSVYWYIKRTGTSGLGSSVETDNGGSSSYSASMTYTFGSSDSGDYIITAYIYDYSDNTTYQVEHTVRVSGSSSSDATPNCSDCTSHCSSPCRCTNSGTCNGTVSTPPTPSDNTPDCSYCTDGCSSCPSSSGYDPGCGHIYDSLEAYEALPGNCVIWEFPCSICNESYWACQGHEVETVTCSCGATVSKCVNVSQVQCLVCYEYN